MEQVFTVTCQKSVLEQNFCEGLQLMEYPCWSRGQA